MADFRCQRHPRSVIPPRLSGQMWAAPASFLTSDIRSLTSGSRKEVIQPQVLLQLPCYDFTPVADLTVAGCLPCGLAHRLKVEPTPMV